MAEFWTVRRLGSRWMATGTYGSDSVTLTSRHWREAYAFAYVAAYGTPTAFWAMFKEVETTGALSDYYTKGVGERVSRHCDVCASP